MDNKFFLLYYSNRHTTVVEGEETQTEVDHDAIREIAQKIKPKDGVLLLRSAEAFDGIIETLDGNNPGGIMLVGDGPAIDRVKEVYEEAEIGVDGLSYEGFLEIKEAPEAPPANDPFNGDLDLLKARAVELQINFPSNIAYEKLKAKVDEAEEAAKAHTE